jgi:hypothetical protein
MTLMKILLRFLFARAAYRARLARTFATPVPAA